MAILIHPLPMEIEANIRTVQIRTPRTIILILQDISMVVLTPVPYILPTHLNKQNYRRLIVDLGRNHLTVIW